MVDKHQTQPDPESTLVHKPQAEPDPEATWTGAPPELGEADRTLLDAAVADGDPEATLVVGLRPGVQPAADPEATVVYRAHAGESPGAEASVATPLQGLRQFQARGEPVAADLEFLVGLNPLVAAANRV